jgi:peroxiredoxin
MKIILSVLIYTTLFFSIYSSELHGQTINDSLSLSLMNIDGKLVSTKDYQEAKGFMIVFTCNHCPFAKLYPERLNALSAKYKKLGVPLIAISSTDSVQYEEDDFAHMVLKAKKEKFNFPYLYDRNQAVAKNYRAQKTPHAFLIWKEKSEFKIKYNGAIDDNGMNAKGVKQAFLEKAVEELLQGKNVSVPETKSIGCQIYFRN